jgi:hypothetical protein
MKIASSQSLCSEADRAAQIDSSSSRRPAPLGLPEAGADLAIQLGASVAMK